MVTQETLGFLFSLLHKESGLALDESKSYLIESRLQPIAVQEGFSSIDDLGRHMRLNPSSLLRQKIVDAMATHETSFFRDRTPFDLLKKTLLPEFLKKNETNRRLRIWSAASSSGQEPYSIAMLLSEMGPLLHPWDAQILATDIAEEVLIRARSGLYSQFEVQRGLEIAYLTRYFSQHPGGWEVKPEVKKFVKFQKLNILSNFSSLGPFDIIFCRNILIYFDSSTKKKVLEQMARTLSSDGVLILGGAESPLGIISDFVRMEAGKGVYYKKMKRET